MRLPIKYGAMRRIAIVNSQGQVTIPAIFRRMYGLAAGTKVYFEEANGMLFLVPCKSDRPLSLKRSRKVAVTTKR
ncbi:AbrB/MazE/SpoVT family DNA-binding domain-containing protein [Terracidiphilus gabretensis]|uniref:AbrB/MazE/SpoVT family DNA-binding domain-containing protein n=1 Tax=Terracidiphilus gabretensis TaxID=1577687 RepID=UPI0012F957E7